MAGRLRPIQLSPFECQTSFGGLVAGRHNLDLQDIRHEKSLGHEAVDRGGRHFATRQLHAAIGLHGQI